MGYNKLRRRSSARMSKMTTPSKILIKILRAIVKFVVIIGVVVSNFVIICA